MGQLVRFGVSMDEDLLARFEQLVARRGTGANRSEAVRDLVRGALVESEWEDSDRGDRRHRHHGLQPWRLATCRTSSTLCSTRITDKIVSAMHVHLDAHNCLEVLVVRGSSAEVRDIADDPAGHQGREARQARDHHRRAHL